MATGRELQQMDGAAKELRRVMDPAVAWATEQEEGVFTSLLLNDAERAAIGAIKIERARAEEWLTTWRGWAERGTDGTGEPYPVSFYLRVGRDLASAFSTYTKQGINAGAFVLGETIEQTATDIGKGFVRVGSAAGNVLSGAEDLTRALARPWPLWVKLAGTLGAVTVGIFTLRALVEKIPNLERRKGTS